LFPSSMGARIAQLADLYNEWKINRLLIRFIPASYQIGNNALSGGSSVEAVGGFTLDPTIGVLGYNEAVEAGCKEFNLARPFSWVYKNSSWLYTQPRSGDTNSDIRFVSPCIFTLLAVTPFNMAIKWGSLEFVWDVSFRYPIDAAVELKRVDYKPIEAIRLQMAAMKERRKTEGESKGQNPENGPDGLSESTFKTDSSYLSATEDDSPILISSSQVAVSQKPPLLKPRLKVVVPK